MSKIFASRWHALYWAAGILLLAYCTVPAAEPEKQGGTQEHSGKPEPEYDKWDKANRNKPIIIRRK